MRAFVVGGLATLLISSAPARADDARSTAPVARVAVGIVGYAHANSPDLLLELTAGAVVPLRTKESSGPFLNPEIGVTLDSGSLETTAFNATCGLGYGHPLAWVAFQPRLLLGATDSGEFLVGLRVGVSLHLLADTISLEVSEMYTKVGFLEDHGTAMLFGLNLLGLVALLGPPEPPKRDASPAATALSEAPSRAAAHRTHDAP